RWAPGRDVSLCIGLFGGRATVVLVSLLRFNVSWVRGSKRRFAVLPASRVAVDTTYNRSSVSKGEAENEEALASDLRDRRARNCGSGVRLERLRAELRHPLQAELGRIGRGRNGQAGRRVGGHDLSADRGGDRPVKLAELQHGGAQRLADR